MDGCVSRPAHREQPHVVVIFDVALAQPCDPGDMALFTSDLAIRLGGWSREHARVIKLEVGDDVACAVIDANGDGSHIDIDWYAYGDAGWVVTDSWTDIRLREAEQFLS